MEQEGQDVAAKKVVVRAGSSSCAHCHKRLLHRHQSMEDHLRICHPDETPAASSSPSSSSTTSATSSTTTLSQSHDSSTSTTSSRKRKGLASSSPAPSQSNHIVIDEDEDEGEQEEKRSWEVGEEEESTRLVPRRVARKGTKRARTSSSRLKDKTNVAIKTTLPTSAQTAPTAPQNRRCTIPEDEPTTTPTISTTRSSAKTPRTEDADAAKTTTTTTATTTTTSSSSAAEGAQLDSAVCPICGHHLETQDSARINQHIDECLTRSMLIQERDAHNADRTAASAALAAPPHPPPHLIAPTAAAASASALGFAPSMPDARDACRATTGTPLAVAAAPVPPVRALDSKTCLCPYGCRRVMAFDKLGKHARNHHAGDGQALECPICVSVTGLAGVVEEDLLEHLNVNHDPRYAAKQSKHRRARGRGVHSWKPPAPDGRHQPAAAVVDAAVRGSASTSSPSPLTIRLSQATLNSVGTTAHRHDSSAMAASGSVANAFAAQPLSALLASTPTQTSAEFATTRVLLAELPEDKAECPICFENLAIGTKVSYLQCLCIFHECCIQAWWDKHKQLECPTHLQD